MYEVLYELHNLFRGIRLRRAAAAAFVLRLISFTVGSVLREQLKIHAPFGFLIFYFDLLSPVLRLPAVRACVVDCSFTPAPAKKGIQKAASFLMRLGAVWS